jgi:hypothetical protein
VRLELTTALVLTVAAALTPAQSRATTVTVTGGGGLDQGEICLASGLCPSTPDVYGLSQDGGISGTFVYTPGSGSTGTVSFDLTLTAPAVFTATSGSTSPGAIQLLANSTFSGTVNVTATASGSSSLLTQTGLALSNDDSFNFSTGTTALETTPIISALTCSIGPGSSACGLTLGPSDLQLTSGGTQYSAQWTIDTIVTPVPVPAAAWLFGSALAGFAWALRKRRV